MFFFGNIIVFLFSITISQKGLSTRITVAFDVFDSCLFALRIRRVELFNGCV